MDPILIVLAKEISFGIQHQINASSNAAALLSQLDGSKVRLMNAHAYRISIGYHILVLEIVQQFNIQLVL